MTTLIFNTIIILFLLKGIKRQSWMLRISTMKYLKNNSDDRTVQLFYWLLLFELLLTFKTIIFW